MSKSKQPKRWSAKRKQEVVLRLLRGESLDALSRETGQPASVLSGWRDEFLGAGMAALKRRTDDPEKKGTFYFFPAPVESSAKSRMSPFFGIAEKKNRSKQA